ncbi:hypothetical protein EHR_05060 [Enterococcus hirae ATCC 9790]|uniref:Uncharacterized protein n=1 Tax=Enterococcus hirae (strain ATCC 9790 / DSM 20160 / JCM 8729 / LMG 6399 / NBRC 3181 / NCIMB 6459 / NCDO 1258 / NCTC 12367 / WDCM 00089 / R) TaxID=768486 RepID=I6S000_ENTHA|nr:hypothetical protein EHR_05060 [Enterococcus hirae ATCC 9790]
MDLKGLAIVFEPFSSAATVLGNLSLANRWTLLEVRGMILGTAFTKR